MTVVPLRQHPLRGSALIYVKEEHGQTLLMWSEGGRGGVLARFTFPDMAATAGHALALRYRVRFEDPEGEF